MGFARSQRSDQGDDCSGEQTTAESAANALGGGQIGKVEVQMLSRGHGNLLAAGTASLRRGSRPTRNTLRASECAAPVRGSATICKSQVPATNSTTPQL